MYPFTSELFTRQYDANFATVLAEKNFWAIDSDTHSFIISLETKACIFSSNENKLYYSSDPIEIICPQIKIILSKGQSLTDEKGITIKRTSLSEVINSVWAYFMGYAYPVRIKYYSLNIHYFLN